jgi:hypothetical protein
MVFLRREAAKFKVSKECAKATFCVRMILKEAKKIKVQYSTSLIIVLEHLLKGTQA